MPALRKISMDQPWVWLSKGWSDLRKAPSVGLGYGALFAVTGFALLLVIYALDIMEVLLPLVGGFLLIAPVLAVGLYETSHRIETGQPTSMALALTAWQRNIGQVSLIGMALFTLYMVWILLALLIFMLFFSYDPPSPDTFIQEVFFSVESIPFLIVGSLVGAVLATLVFAISAISVPMLLDRNVNMMLAIATSFEAVRQNPAPMFVWGCLIMLFTAAGLASFFLGLIVTLPLIGHATWHAYRDLTEPAAE
jgi:uncharacterized membrane protein